MEPDKPWDEWLSAATGGVRFSPDREAAREELSGHLEDKAAELRRVFPDMTEEEARERALQGMGDAAEIGRALAKIHRPWMGWLWTASKILLGVVLTVLGVEALLLLGTLWGLVWPEVSAALAQGLGL